MNPSSPSSPQSQSGGRRPLLSDCEQHQEESNSLGQRSVSLTTLQQQPRMAQLETLEAKMASIEVSLSSSTPRRRKNGSLGASIRSIPKEIAAKELESLRNALRDKENIIQSLKGQLTIPGLRLSSCMRNNNNNHSNSNRDLTEVEKKQAEERLGRLKTDVDNKRLAIKNLKLALERLDITDNIDVRIQQAELEYQLGREELNLLTLLEETRALQLCLEESNKNSSECHTLYTCVNDGSQVMLVGLELDFDPKNPKFGASQRESTPGLWIDWALEETGMRKGDRLLEVNGKIVLTKTREDLSRLLAAAPDPAQIVTMRKIPPTSSETSSNFSDNNKELEAVRSRAEEVEKTRDSLVSDNIRLTHRISYLEEQVQELLTRVNPPPKTSPHEGENVRIVSKSPVISTVNTTRNVTNINITTQPPQLQKDNGHPRSKSSLSNVSNTHIPAPEEQSIRYCSKGHRNKYKSVSTQNLEQDNKISFRKHHHHHHHNVETNSLVNGNKRNSVEFHHKANSEKDFRGDNLMDQSYKKATKIVHELTGRDSSSLYEKHRQKCITASEKYINSDLLKHYNARKSTSVLDFRSEVHIGPKYSYADSRSVEDLDDSKQNNAIAATYHHHHNYNKVNKIQDSRSVQSLDFDSDCNSSAILNNGGRSKKSFDYTSEPNDTSSINGSRKLSAYYYNNSNNIKPRPTPPKKPLRLSLHKTQSLQSVETPPVTPNLSPNNNNNNHHVNGNGNNMNGKNIESCRKRNYKGEVPPNFEGNGKGHHQDLSPTKWVGFSQNVDGGSWC